MNIRILLPVIIFSIFITGCEKTSANLSPTGGLTPFDVTVVQRSAYQAIINWTGSSNLNVNNSDTVKYKVEINNNIIATNLLTLTYTITGISPDTTYNGRVIAYTSADTISSPFVLEKIREFIGFYSGFDAFSMYNFNSGVLMWTKTIQYNWYPNTRIGAPTFSNDTVFFADTYNSAGEPILFAAAVKTGQIYWSALTGNHIPGSTMPVYGNGKIFVLTANGVTALSSTTGQIFWTRPLPNATYGLTPVYANNKIFVMTPHNHLCAINESDGTIAWSYPVGYIATKPVTVNSAGVVVFTTNGKMIALNQQTGTLAWQKSWSSDVYWSQLLVTGSTIVTLIEDVGFHAINASNGNILWMQPNDWIMNAGIYQTIGNGKYYCYDALASPKKIFALNLSNGTLAWEQISLVWPMNDMVYANNRLYGFAGVSSYGAHGFIRILDAASGQYLENAYSIYER